MITFTPPPGQYNDPSIDITVTAPVGSRGSFAIDGYPLLVQTISGSNKYPAQGLVPYIQTVNDGLGKLVLDGAFTKYYNNRWTGAPSYNQLKDSEKVLCNFITYILDGGTKLLVLGDRDVNESYSVVSNQGTSFHQTFLGIASVLGISVDFKVYTDYAENKLDPTYQELIHYNGIFVLSGHSTLPSGARITEQGATNLAEARRAGIGLYLCTDHGSDDPTGQGFYATANKILAEVTNAAFAGNYNFSPGETIGFNRANFGDSPIFSGLPDSTIIPASSSDSKVDQNVPPPQRFPINLNLTTGHHVLRVMVEDSLGNVKIYEAFYSVNAEAKIKLLPDPVIVEPNDSLGYYNLTKEDEQGNPPGTPIYEGGEWFPTTHVEIENRNGKTNLDVLTLAEFFYEIANYNLVLNAIDNARDMVVTDTLGNNKTEIVAVAGVLDKVIVMSNFGRYGATPPPLVELTPGKPVQRYGEGSILLTAPNSWYLDSEGRKLLVYSMEHRQEKDNGSIPTQVTGNLAGSDASNYIVLTGPIEYINIPGAARTQAQIPVWRAEPTVENTQSLPTNYVGAGYSIVANPTGWYEIQPGLFTPYWE